MLASDLRRKMRTGHEYDKRRQLHMKTDIERLYELGGLHDAEVCAIVWQAVGNAISFTIKDMFSNCEGLPHYPGPKGGSVTLLGVKSVMCKTAPFQGVVIISGIDVALQTAGVEVRIGLREPGSDIRVLCEDLRLAVDS
jgi:hypothetical protein